ncbi:MAG: zinc ribbon domain-containing protein [Candidatus Eremiobacteraeota bacterium]|nr:zinc ribbon domain-containing protein [Candidatus Eremiobacteraeota bacterium]
MKFFTQLYNSLWRQHGDEFSKARQHRHYGSMAEQVMGNRNEILHLQGELDRVSHDLSQAMTLNRALIKLLVSEGVGTPEKLEQMLGETLLESRLELAENEAPSRFCEECGRPLAHPGRACPYCTELALVSPAAHEEQQPEAVEEDESEESEEPSDAEDEDHPAESESESEEAPKAKKKKRSKKK